MTGLRRAAVIGAGTIGLSWTALFAGHGLDVWVYHPRPDLADAVRQALTEFGPHLATQGLDVAGLTQRVHLSLAGLTPAHALLLSSSSAIPATAFTDEPADASRVLIGHPFNPPHIVPLVEVVPGARTEQRFVGPCGRVLSGDGAGAAAYRSR
jgi:ketoreductase RED1